MGDHYSKRQKRKNYYKQTRSNREGGCIMSSSLKKDIIAILSEELDIYKAILRETYQQIDMIKKMDIDGLQIILHEKDKCINKIEISSPTSGILRKQSRIL